MKQFISKGRTWTVDNYHKWADREFQLRIPRTPMVDKSSSIVAIGSCFATEVVDYLSREGFDIHFHPNGLQYNTFTMCAELERLFGDHDPYGGAEPIEVKPGRFRHPYKKIKPSDSPREAVATSLRLDDEARAYWRKADVIIITLGLTEVWREVSTGRVQVEIPHPAVYNPDRFRFEQTRFAENLANLERIHALIRSVNDAPIVVTVSPVPLYATFSGEDVTVANSESKSILRAVAGQFSKDHDGVHYFPSFELVMYSMDPGTYMKEDGRHVNEQGVAAIMEHFLMNFGTEDIAQHRTGVDAQVKLRGIDTAEMHEAARERKRARRAEDSRLINRLLRPVGLRISKR